MSSNHALGSGRMVFFQFMRQLTLKPNRSRPGTPRYGAACSNSHPLPPSKRPHFLLWHQLSPAPQALTFQEDPLSSLAKVSHRSSFAIPMHLGLFFRLPSVVLKQLDESPQRL